MSGTETAVILTAMGIIACLWIGIYQGLPKKHGIIAMIVIIIIAIILYVLIDRKEKSVTASVSSAAKSSSTDTQTQNQGQNQSVSVTVNNGANPGNNNVPHAQSPSIETSGSSTQTTTSQPNVSVEPPKPESGDRETKTDVPESSSSNGSVSSNTRRHNIPSPELTKAIARFNLRKQEYDDMSNQELFGTVDADYKARTINNVQKEADEVLILCSTRDNEIYNKIQLFKKSIK